MNMSEFKKKRLPYIITAAVLLITEVLIGLFVHDGFVRPYLGDVIVVILIWVLLKIFFTKTHLLPLWVFLFACFVEFTQYIKLVELIGLSDIAFFRTVMGTSFSWWDILCYAVGCAICAMVEITLWKRENR